MKRHLSGLVSVSFRKHSPLEILTEMQKCSLSLVEWGSDVHAPCTDENNLRDILHLQKEMGISCCSYGTYFRLGINEISELERYIYAANILGTDILRLWCGDKSSEKYTQSEKHSLFRACREASEIAQKYGATLCMECHNNTYTETLAGTLELMNELNSESFGMYWQPNQFRSLEENAEYAARISGYVRNVHVFNWHDKEQHPLSEAADAWKRYLDCFKDPKCFLLEFMPDGRIESLKKESEALCEILNK